MPHTQHDTGALRGARAGKARRRRGLKGSDRVPLADFLEAPPARAVAANPVADLLAATEGWLHSLVFPFLGREDRLRFLFAVEPRRFRAPGPEELARAAAGDAGAVGVLGDCGRLDRWDAEYGATGERDREAWARGLTRVQTKALAAAELEAGQRAAEAAFCGCGCRRGGQNARPHSPRGAPTTRRR